MGLPDDIQNKYPDNTIPVSFRSQSGDANRVPDSKPTDIGLVGNEKMFGISKPVLVFKT
mgnify:CR=1 FL=1